MADIQQQASASDHRSRRPRYKRSSTHMDMTPMVDLAFLLLTFFILTTSFKTTRIIDLQMPDVPHTPHPNTIGKSQAFNLILLKDNKAKWYIGDEDDAVNAKECSFDEKSPVSIRKILADKNAMIITAINAVNDSVTKGLIPNKENIIKAHIETVKKNPKGLVVLVKLSNKSRYENLVCAMNEILISHIGRYCIVEVGEKEKSVMAEL